MYNRLGPTFYGRNRLEGNKKSLVNLPKMVTLGPTLLKRADSWEWEPANVTEHPNDVFFCFIFFCVCVYLECRGSKTLNITDPGSTWQRLANIGEYNIMIHCLFSYFEDPGVPSIAHHFGKTHHWVTVEIPSSNPSGFST